MPRKQLPPFSYEKKEGEVKEITLHSINSHNRNGLNGQLIVSRYSDFIPISYLNINIQQISKANSDYFIRMRVSDYLRSKGIKVDRNKLIDFSKKIIKKESKILDFYIHSLYNEDYKKWNLELINEFINYSVPYNIVFENYGSRSFDRMFYSFSESSYTRSYITSPLSKGNVDRGIVTVQRNEEMIPIIVIAIPKENYFYSKLYYLKHGTLDLSKCIVLIDRELDSPSFPEKGVRNTLYKKKILPYLEKMSIDVWKVPNSYIKEKCFLGDYKLEGRTLMEKKEKIEEIRKGFCTELREKYNKNKSDIKEETPYEGILSELLRGQRERQPYTIMVGTEALSSLQQAVTTASSEGSYTMSLSYEPSAAPIPPMEYVAGVDPTITWAENALTERPVTEEDFGEELEF